eukprot:9548060-Alexandrium_andersonii.AAC.1
MADIRRAALRSHGSAPWADGLPYKTFRCGCDFVADLVGQVPHASRMDDGWVEFVLWPNVELL